MEKIDFKAKKWNLLEIKIKSIDQNKKAHKILLKNIIFCL
jgi:hypothetical protein